MIRDELRIPLTMLKISFLDKLKFKGSYKGKRFQFEKIVDKNDKSKVVLRVYIWKDLLNFENTDIKDMKIQDFEYTPNGIEQGIDLVEITGV